jgi:hypothetical protein
MSGYDFELRKWLWRAVHGTELNRVLPRQKRRETPARDWKYRAWIRHLPCAACGSERYVEAAHTGSDGGMSQKASDYSCIPLCAWCHRCGPESYHVIGRSAFEELHGLNCRALRTRLYRTWKLLQMPGGTDEC